jgi:hypothetical protein
MCYPQPESETLPGSGGGRAAIACIEGDPLAGLLALWVEDRQGAPALMALRGSTVGCYREEFVPADAILLAPEGEPADSVKLIDACSGDPVAHREVGLTFSSALDAALAWDPAQPHPEIPAVETGHDGNATFRIRGGGCSEAGAVGAWCEQPLEALPIAAGARSPDVDGDCLVGGDDLAYVESRFGSDDFCADLNGSGLVDAADAAIVRLTLGDHCSDLPSAVGESAGRAAAVTLLANPCLDAAVVRCDLPAAARVSLRVVDPAGALVRDLGVRDLPAGSSTVVWDTRGSGGRRAAAGVYFLSLRAAGWEVRRSVLVLQ